MNFKPCLVQQEKNAVLASIAPRIGVRETRRILGQAAGSMAVVASSRAQSRAQHSRHERQKPVGG
jgi:hypothetical protein